MPMKIDEIVTLLKSPEFYQKVFLSKATADADSQFYYKIYKELSEAYQELKNAGKLPSAHLPNEIQLSAEIEFALGGLCKAIASNLSSKLYVGSIDERIKALEVSDKDFNNAIQYFESAIISTNPSNEPHFETNRFRFRIAEQLVNTYELMANRYRKLDLVESAISALERQRDALSQSSKYLPMLALQKKNQITVQITQIEASINKIKMNAAVVHLSEILNSIFQVTFDEDKLHKEMVIIRNLQNIPLLSTHLRNLIEGLSNKSNNFISKMMDLVTQMKPDVDIMLVALKHEDNRMFSKIQILLSHSDASTFNFLQSLIDKCLELHNELSTFNSYLAKHHEEEKIDATKLQAGLNASTLLTERDLLLKSCLDSLKEIKGLKEGEMIKSKKDALLLSPLTSTAMLPDRLFSSLPSETPGASTDTTKPTTSKTLRE